MDKVPHFESFEELQKHVEALMKEQNSRVHPNFEGYSPLQMHALLHQPFSRESPLQMMSLDVDTCLQVPILQLVQALMQRIANVGNIALTKTGALPTKWVQELYALGFIKEYFIECGLIKVYKETDTHSINLAHILLYLGGLAKKRNGKLSLTKTGIKLLSDPIALLHEIFNAFTQKFNWGYFDRYENKEIGRLAFAFTLTLLHKHGHQRLDANFYADKYITAFPLLAEQVQPDFGTANEYVMRCYKLRTMELFLPYFGLIIFETKGRSYNSVSWVTKTALFDQWFKVKT
jgi:hypothetical protein